MKIARVVPALILGLGCLARADMGVGEKDPGFAVKSLPAKFQGQPLAVAGGKLMRLGFSFAEAYNSVVVPTLYFVEGDKINTAIVPKGYECLKNQVDTLTTALGDAELKTAMKKANEFSIVVEYTPAPGRQTCFPFSVLLLDRLLVRPCFADDTPGVNPAAKECQLVTVEMFKKQFARYAEGDAKAAAIHEGLRNSAKKAIEALTK